MQKPAYLSAFLLMLSIGCGPSNAVSANQAAKKDETPSGVQIAAARDGKLTCEFIGECEPSLALVSVATVEGLERCSGFLISDHEILTNDHCLNTISGAEKSCQGLVFAHFNGDVHRGCKRIRTRSYQSGINSKDYAVIELDKPVRDRKPLPLSKRGFNPDETATVFRVQMTDGFNGIQTKLVCHASYSTLMNINITSARDPLMTFGDCAIEPGNSGAPIFNKNGEVGAIVQGFLQFKDQSVSALLEPYLLDEGYGQVSIGTQTRCMPELVGDIANGCEKVKPISSLYPNDYLRAFGGFASEKKLPSLSAEQKWREIPADETGIRQFFATPVCVSREDSFQAQVVSFKIGINSRLQAEWRVQNDSQEVFVRSGITSANVEFRNDQFGTVRVPICSR